MSKRVLQTALVLIVTLMAACTEAQRPPTSSGRSEPVEERKPADEPLLDWSPWQKYRASVIHPAATVKPPDLERARANLQRYEWARRYRDSLERGVKDWVQKVTPEFLAQMVPTTTPGDTLFTPCPACRDLAKPYHPHGQWKWSVQDAEKLTCAVCGTVFPNDKYPESIVLHAKYGGGQTFTYCGGEPFKIFSFVGRPSFSASIRAHKAGFMASLCRRLAEAYALTGKTEYARATRLILLRFAEVYPNWLVHVGYGEYADMNPHIAALNIGALPQDELTPPPNLPDRRLHTGYWSAGRARGVGMEAGFVRQMVEAYEFTCEAREAGKPVYTEADRLKIEKDLLLESTVLLVADKAVNNKSVGNATAVALVGMSVGHPSMVRFGLDVFMKTVDGWFLPDGGTSESWGYALMTLGGIEALGQALHGYTDPPGYAGPDGKRIEKMDLYHDTAYKKAWAAMFNGLQGNLLYPPLADGHRTNGIGGRYAELMADNYPENPQYLALLKTLAGDDLSRGDSQYAIYYREPGLEKKESPPLAFPDYVFPVLQIGYLRSGDTGRAPFQTNHPTPTYEYGRFGTGRDSALILSASAWGGHHHLDSLNLYYWQAYSAEPAASAAKAGSGRELLSDLGYLWDHPMSYMTRRTFAHNTVMVDGADQITKGRGGKFTLFSASGKVKVMEAESNAYPQCNLYRRTVVQIEHAPGRQYVVDIFRVRGGAKHEYVFHGPNNDMEVQGPALRPWDEQGRTVRFCLRFHLDKAGSEIYVDDLSIIGPDGRNVMTNPSAWQLYHGDGKADWGISAQGHGDQAKGAFLKALEAGKQMMNVALIAGDSDGYKGVNAFEGKVGQTYKVRFWMRGRAPHVGISALYWPNDPNSANDRHSTEVVGLVGVVPKPEWTEYTGQFTIPGAVDMQNVRGSNQAAPWKLTWKIDKDLNFTALWPNTKDQTSLLGDGWGQRDYRNSDVGTTLPYIVRRCMAGKIPSVFVTAFEGFAPARGVVKGMKILPNPDTSAKGGSASGGDNTVAVSVETDEGTDYIVSCLAARPIKLETLEGPLEMNGRFAVLSVQNGIVAAAALVEGTQLRWKGQDVRP